MKLRIRGSFTSLRQSALLTALTLLGSVWAMAQVAAVPVKAPEASSPAYPLKLSANRRYLVDQNNIPFLITGDNPHALLGMGSTADAETYFADRQAHGFNAIWMNMLVASPTYYDSRDDGSTPDGIRPFTGYIAGGTDSAHYDLTKPNEAYFTRVDEMLTAAANHRLVVFLDPIDTCCTAPPARGVWLQALLNNGLTAASIYGNYLGERYKRFDNIVWLHGDDFNTWQTPDDDALVQAVAKAIKSADPRALQTVELNVFTSSSLDDPTWAPIISLNSTYTYSPTYMEMLHSYNQAPVMPTYLVEGHYDLEKVGEPTDYGTPWVLRRQGYWTMLSGGTGQLYGNAYTWPFISGWKFYIDTLAVAQLMIWKEFFSSLSWQDLVPDQDHTTVIAGLGTYGNLKTRVSRSDFCTAARTSDGSYVVAYMPTARTVTVNMASLKAPANAKWFDPTNGAYTMVPGGHSRTQEHGNSRRPGTTTTATPTGFCYYLPWVPADEIRRACGEDIGLPGRVSHRLGSGRLPYANGQVPTLRRIVRIDRENLEKMSRYNATKETDVMTTKLGLVSFILLVFISPAYSEPITLHPANPRYYLFNGQPTILITSAEHYGAVINLDFDYVRYFDALKAYGLNYTRIWPGAVLEMVGEFVKGNTMGPKPRRTIVPWARSDEPGYVYGGNKFDLDKWNPDFFARLKDFIVKAAERGIVVEVCFFNSQYTHRWPLSPLYYENNIQGVGKCDFKDAQTLKYPDLVQRESEYVSKITQEVNAYDNLILEICDEPSNFAPHAEAGPWVGLMLQVVHDTEAKLPKQHLVAQMVEGPIGGPVDFSGSPLLSIITGQYVWGGEADSEQMGGMKGLDYEYHYNKPIEMNETPYYPFQYGEGDPVLDSRVEAWEFMVGGGASFNHLNSRYTVEDPAGNTPDNAQVLGALRNLKNFIYSFEFIKMRAARSLTA